MYEVIADKFVGKHGVYLKGAKIQESEVMKGELELALNGQKDVKNKRGQALPNIPAKLKKATPAKKTTTKASK